MFRLDALPAASSRWYNIRFFLGGILPRYWKH